ncbi:hypothetical protein [Legionella cardiaca]|uniref:Dot/Icm T4SS effector n=1 Tax=Legionella cardiaca TaxID=1071983 RepID=A0ABY8AS94_9GAMM|nr:hypothetical protein [Legionella cardiaca]WED43334.1 hypothetical protein PXX05_00750 [Legionella cardiaca]
MNPLLPLMRSEKPLGIDQQLAKGDVASALKDAFTVLTGAAGLSLSSEIPVFFSIDSNETAYNPYIPFEDKFEEAIAEHIGTPNAKICHMRLYADESGRAHWHSLFAEMDEDGNLKQITITDSRLKDGGGITAQKDIDNNLFLRENANKIKFIAGESQPFGVHICWIYCLANLASLAACGKVYQSKTKHLGIELADIIERHSKLKKHSSALATTTKQITETPLSSPPRSELTDATTEIIERQEDSPSDEITFTSKKTQTATSSLNNLSHFGLFPPVEDKQEKPSEIEISNSTSALAIADPNQSSLALKWGGASSLFVGAGTCIVGGLSLTPLLPLSLPFSIALISVGVALALAGIVMLAVEHFSQKNLESGDVNTPSVVL